MQKVQPVVIPNELKNMVNPVKKRILFLSPSVLSGEERECRKDDFESLANSNIGVGGFGKVYKVRHKVSKNVYAIKVINKAKIIEHDLVEQIKLEVQIMYNLNHEHIVKLYNHYEDDENFYLILQYCAKGQLYTMLKREVKLNERLAAQYLREVISAVQYLHSLDPPIIHRDIKPENILLDSNNSVKLADFGWSNFFNGDRRRLTYCGTPEYLAPEMIQQCGHDKSLDIWNLGVLMFELLTGSPPFEGANQNELFDNILKFKIKWPKGFSGVARDLVTKLLKTNPAERTGLDEVLNHPWFKSNPPVKPVLAQTPTAISPSDTSSQSVASAQSTQQPQNQLQQQQTKIVLDESIKKENYQIVSKPSIQNKAEAQSEQRQSLVINQKLEKVNINANNTNQQQVQSNNNGSSNNNNNSKNDNTNIDELNGKIAQSKKEINELKLSYQQKCKELEQMTKDFQEYKDSVKDKLIYNKDSQEVKKLNEEIQKLRSLNKNRDEIIQEMENKSKTLRETETQLKLTQNDIESLTNSTKSLEQKNKDLQDKIEQLEIKLQQYKEKAFQAEKEKEQSTIEYQNKIEFLQYKLLNKAENIDGSEGGVGGDDKSGSFKELLGLCKSDLEEILQRLRQQMKGESIEDQLRKELLEMNKKMNELKSQQEAALYEKQSEYFQKVEKMQQKFENEKKVEINKYKEQVQQKNERIKELEKNEKKLVTEKERSESLSKQMKEMQERLRSIATDHEMMKQEKKYADENLKKYEEKINDYEYQLKKK